MGDHRVRLIDGLICRAIAPLLVAALLLGAPSISQATPRSAGQTVAAARKKARPSRTRRRRHVAAYSKRPGVRMPRSVERRVAALARDFFRRSGRQLVVTSGYRTAAEQASVMYAKARQGRRRLLRLYRKTDLALQIYGAYRKTRKRRRGPRATVRAMAAVIRRQIKQGKFISAHLHHGAVDIRSRGMSRRQRALFLRLARAIPGARLVIRERHPPHWHVELSVK